MVERKPLSKKIRFEVFKRDSFTCQYCGQKAPDVILEVDHITPVSKGGKNEILNLVTSCFDCNRGKKDRVISDLSIIEKQRMQIEELNIRRQQLEMMLNWRNGLSDLENAKHKAAIDLFNEKWDDSELNEKGEKTIKTLVKKYNLQRVLDAIELSIEKYKKSEDDFELCLKKVGGILAYEDMPVDKKLIAYIKGICRNKFSYVPEPKLSIKLNEYNENNYSLEQLKQLLISGEFRTINGMFNWMED